MYPRHSQITRGKGSTHSCDVCAGKNRVSAYACRRYDFNVHRRSDVKLAVSRRCRQPRKVRIGPHLARRGWPAPKPSGSTASSLPHHVGLGEGLGARALGITTLGTGCIGRFGTLGDGIAGVGGMYLCPCVRRHSKGWASPLRSNLVENTLVPEWLK
jgi:hypothetical protein